MVPAATAATLVSVEEYLSSTFRPDCDYVDGRVLERNVGKKNHSFVQTNLAFWFRTRAAQLAMMPFVEQRLQVAPGRFRIPDVLVVRQPVPDEQVFTTAPYLCIEVMSPEDTMSSLQDRVDDYIQLGVVNVWVIDPWRGRAWTVDAAGWHTALDGFLRTVDKSVAMPLEDVLP